MPRIEDAGTIVGERHWYIDGVLMGEKELRKLAATGRAARSVERLEHDPEGRLLLARAEQIVAASGQAKTYETLAAALEQAEEEQRPEGPAVDRAAVVTGAGAREAVDARAQAILSEEGRTLADVEDEAELLALYTRAEAELYPPAAFEAKGGLR